MGTWWARHVPSTGNPSTTLGPVQPLGVRSTMAGQAGRVRSPSTRARRWISWISLITVSIIAASCWCTSFGSSPSTV